MDASRMLDKAIYKSVKVREIDWDKSSEAYDHLDSVLRLVALEMKNEMDRNGHDPNLTKVFHSYKNRIISALKMLPYSESLVSAEYIGEDQLREDLTASLVEDHVRVVKSMQEQIRISEESAIELIRTKDLECQQKRLDLRLDLRQLHRLELDKIKAQYEQDLKHAKAELKRSSDAELEESRKSLTAFNNKKFYAIRKELEDMYLAKEEAVLEKAKLFDEVRSAFDIWRKRTEEDLKKRGDILFLGNQIADLERDLYREKNKSWVTKFKERFNLI